MGCCCRMNGETLCVAHVREMTEELQAFDEFLAGFHAAFNPKPKNGARSFRQILLCALVVGMALQTRIENPANLGMLFQAFRNRLCVLYMAIHAQAEGFD